jgi:predicted  nucleic acid-binding Zn-ribbon protein
MGVSLEQALTRLNAALGQLEVSVARRLDAERRRGDLETELQIMQDDRARLAGELDAALARLDRVEAAAQDVGRRVTRAAGAIREVVTRTDAAALS